MGPEWLVFIIVALIVLLVALDPATMRYRYDLPTLPRAGGAATPGSGPPHRRRRRRRRQTDAEGG